MQKKYSYENNYNKIIISSQRHTYQENKILKQTSFLENLTIIQNANLIVRYLLKFLISLATHKLIFCYHNKYTTSKLCFWSCECETKPADAFLTDLIKEFSYIFSPFSLLEKVTCKKTKHTALL